MRPRCPPRSISLHRLDLEDRAVVAGESFIADEMVNLTAVDEQHETATIKALAASEILKKTLEDGAHSLTPSADFHAELERLIAEAKSKLGDE